MLYYSAADSVGLQSSSTLSYFASKKKTFILKLNA